MHLSRSGMNFPGFYAIACSPCLLLLELCGYALLSKPQSRPGLLSLLGHTSHRGSRASFPGSTGCSCVHTASGVRGLPSHTCFFFFVHILLLKAWHAWQRSPEISTLPLPSWTGKLPSTCPVQEELCTGPAQWPPLLLLDGRKQACRRSEECLFKNA